MLSTVFAAEVQFRHDSESQAREFAILESIRDRRAALAGPSRTKARLAPRRAVSWPRPIGAHLDVSDGPASCAIA